MSQVAGNGGLAVFGHVLGSEKNFRLSMYANEIDAVRRRDLETLGIFHGIYGENAEVINDILDDNVKPTVVVMNPPFSQAVRLKGKKDQRLASRHLESAFESLQDNGRLVALVGDGMNTNNTKHKEFFKRMETKGNLLASIAIPGKAYMKYGTSFPTRMLIFDKTFPDTGNKPIIGSVESLRDIVPLLEGVHFERNSPQSPAGKQDSKTSSDAGIKSSAGTSHSVRDTATSRIDVKRDNTTTAPDRTVHKRQLRQDDTTRTVESDDVERVSGGLSPDSIRPGREPGKRSEPDRKRSDGSDRLRQQSDKKRSDGSDRPPASKELTKSVRNDNRQEKSELENIDVEDVSIFDKYVPSVFAEGSGKHPAKIVESAAMALVKPPPTNYQVTLEKEIIKNLSDVQTEAVIMAGAAFEDTLPNGETKGFALGDGTGVGKGRTIAGIMRDWYNKGHKKSVWITESGSLVKDTKRDILDVGWKDANVIPGTKAQETIKEQDGIFFTTYNTLKSGQETAKGKDLKIKKSRLDQLVEWLGKDFDGVIAFDEAHNMGNALPMKNKKASLKALAGVKLQTLLPKAKILYVSATFATRIENLTYMRRLGLWGEGTQFPELLTFIQDINAGGIAAMEYIARDLKALGLYLARSISYEGIKYKQVEHKLSENQ